MSWLDELSELERRAKARLAQLEPEVAKIEPLMTEYNELQQLLVRLGLERAESLPAAAAPAVGSESAAAPKAVAAARTTSSARPVRKRAARKRAATKPSSSKSRASKPAAPAVTAAGAQKPAAARGGGSRRNQARPGERQRQVLELVAARPGIKVSEIAAELGVDATGLYAIVRRLEGKGRLNKLGTGLTVSSSTSKTAVPASA